MNAKELHSKIAAYITLHTELSYQQIADKLHISESTVGQIARKHGVIRPRGPSKSKLKVNMDALNEVDNAQA